MNNLNYDAAIEAAAEGKPLEEVAKALGCSYRQLYREMEKSHEFGQALRRARELGLQLRGDKLLTMVQDNPEVDVQRLKLEADNIKWVLARLMPHVFGDRLEVKVENIDVSAALIEARNRLARSSSDLDQIEDAQYVELPRVSQSIPTDKQSDAVPAPFVNPFDDE